MQQTDILEIVTYLFRNFWQEKGGLPSDSKVLALLLQRAGFHTTAISKAFEWLFELMQKKNFIQEPNSLSWHIFTSLEQIKIDSQCRRYILFLEHNKILKPKSREILISQLMSLPQNAITLTDVNWVTLMVLHTLTEEREALKRLEQLILLS